MDSTEGGCPRCIIEARDPKAKFCKECGNSFGRSEPQPVPQPAQPAQPIPQPVMQTPVLKDREIGLLTTYCQSGKTGNVLEQVADLVSKGVVCVIASLNNRILTDQTTIRAGKISIIKPARIMSNAEDLSKKVKNGDEDKTPGFKDYDSTKGTISAPLAGESTKLHPVKMSCKDAIEGGHINTIAVCSNKRRWNDLEKIVENCSSKGKKVALFIDEADKICKETGKKPVILINKWHREYENVVKIVLITGTPYDGKGTSKRIVWLGQQFGGQLELIHLKHAHGSGYRALKNCTHICEEGSANKIEYVEDYLEKNPPKPGDIDFLPAATVKDSHEDMVAAVLGIHYDAVMIINGTRKEIRFPENTGKSPVYLRTMGPGELKDKLANWYKTNNGKKMTMAITGYICLGRGITFNSPECSITRMIISGETKIADSIQMMSRCAGYEGPKPVIVCPQSMWDMVEKDFEMIRKLTELSKLPTASERLVDTPLIEGLWDTIQTAYNTEKYTDDWEWDTYEIRDVDDKDDLKKKVTFHYPNLNGYTSSRAERCDDGRYQGSYNGPKQLLDYEEIKQKLERAIPTSNMSPGEMKKDQTRFRTYPTYDSDGNLIWLVRWLKAKNDKEDRVIE